MTPRHTHTKPWVTGKELAGYSLTTDQSVVESAFQNYLEKKVHYLKKPSLKNFTPNINLHSILNWTDVK